jgi:phosphopantothenoylcysteine synthetase/decarboxylase
MSKFIIGVTGSISAYKAGDIISGLLKNSKHEIKVIMTENAKKFITPLTLATLSKNPVYDEASEWCSDGSIKHIELSKWADILAIVPATANTITKLTQGIIDNLLTSTYLALFQGEENRGIVICPAMNTHMWEKQQIQDHLKLLRGRPRHLIVNPEEGQLACGDYGMGKLSPTRKIVEAILGHLSFMR